MAQVTKRSKEEMAKLWEEYGRTRDPKIKNILSEEYLPIVRYVAEKMIERLPHNVQVEDLVSSGVFGLFSPAGRYRIRPADIRCTSSTRSPSSVGKSSRLARRSAPAKRRPSSVASGGSNVFRVAMWAGPARSTGNALTGSFSARRQASTSGNSGIYAGGHG